jgi:hypothetical protein
MAYVVTELLSVNFVLNTLFCKTHVICSPYFQFTKFSSINFLQ